MNKFILKIDIIANVDNELQITVFHWDDRYLWSSETRINSDLSDFYTKGEFMMFSYADGYILPDQFVLPDKETYRPNYKLSCTFDTDTERHDFLKKLYDCLTEWGQFWNDALKEKEKIYNDNIIVSGKFWTM